MTVLLYDHLLLEERAARHLKAWKAWHIIIYALAAIFGVLNYVFLQNTMEMVNDNCIFYPRKLEFHMVQLPEDKKESDVTDGLPNMDNNTLIGTINNETRPTNGAANDTHNITKRDINMDESLNETTVVVDNTTIVTALGNTTHRLMLDTQRSLFQSEMDGDCQFAEYMPIICTVSALLWVTLFTMCPSGGHARSGLRQPWRILTPSVLYALVLVGLMAHSFTITNGGIQAFCSGFTNFTNTTACLPVNPYLETSWYKKWSFSGRAAAVRAASAGALVSWACAAAFLVARCLAAPDFDVRRVGVYLIKDPDNKLAPHLNRSPRRGPRTPETSPTKRDATSVRSEPTATTELVTASVEPGHDSTSSSLTATPIKNQRLNIDLAYAPEELKEQ